MFPDRRRIPGRKVKYIIAIGLVFQTYCFVKLNQHKMIYGKKIEQQVSLQRKVAPLFQAVNDIEYTIIKHRWDLLFKEMLGEEFVKKSHYHNREISWVPMYKQMYGWTRGGLGRYPGMPMQYHNDRHWNGFSIQNI